MGPVGCWAGALGIAWHLGEVGMCHQHGDVAGQGACMSPVCRWGWGGGVGPPPIPIPLSAQEVLLKRAADLVEALYGMPHSNQVP